MNFSSSGKSTPSFMQASSVEKKRVLVPLLFLKCQHAQAKMHSDILETIFDPISSSSGAKNHSQNTKGNFNYWVNTIQQAHF